MKNILKPIALLTLGLITFSACELDLQEDPNELSPEQSNPDFLLNGIQLNFSDFFQATQDIGAEITRQENLFGTNWESAFAATDFDNEWEEAYANIIVESKILQEQAIEQELFHHAAIAQVLEAYTWITLVDYFGDIPFTEALDPTNLVPVASPGSEVYPAALGLLDLARANFALEPFVEPEYDLFYEGEEDLWIKAINSLELRIQVQQRLVNGGTASSRINALVSENNLINDNSEAFAFQYGSQQLNPSTQHPDYNGNYTNGANEYMANYFMDKLVNEKTNTDPRTPYYFYRQDVVPTTDVTLRECVGAPAPPWYAPGDPFCLVEGGYWGRDHLDNAGIPPDNELRTTYGIYPAGGKIDGGESVLVEQGDGLGGAGIDPIIMPSFVSFLKAEAALTLGTNGDARSFFMDGVNQSLSYVAEFAGLSDSVLMAYDSIGALYTTEVMAAYDAGSDADRLGLIMNEYYIAAWGNGIDAYNNYRRTGFPNDMQPGVRNANAGVFYRSLIYPASYVNRNANAVQKTTNGVKVFWDTNPDGFID